VKAPTDCVVYIYTSWQIVPHTTIVCLYFLLLSTRLPAVYEKRFGQEFTGACVHPPFFEETGVDLVLTMKI
jgi:hypothetical protein